MSTQINIENYESFYLDYLEGNLGEDDSAALLAFLEEHPDLIVEEELVYLPEAAFVGLDKQSKSELKFPDTDQKIGINNIEIFLIASVEKQLSEEKSQELQAFLNANPFYAEELSLYQRSKLQADLSIVFPEKRSMKKGGIIIPMYVRFAAVAAGVAIAVMVFNAGNDQPTHLASGKKVEQHDIKLNQSGSGSQAAKGQDGQETIVHIVNSPESNNTGSAQENLAQTNPQEVVNSSTSNSNSSNSIARPERQVRLKTKPVKAVNHNRLFNTPDLAAHPKAFAPQPSEIDASVEGSLAMVDMKNPIQPITNRIAKVLKREVDFKTTKAARKKSGGFYLKIGKLEISRKVYDNTSVAVK